MTGETFKEPTFQFIPSDEPSSDLFFQFAFDESSNLVDLPIDDAISIDHNKRSRILSYFRNTAMFLMVGFLTLSYSGLIKNEIQSNKTHNSIAQLSISNPVNLLTSFYQPLTAESNETTENQDLNLTIPSLEVSQETAVSETVADETIDEGLVTLEETELEMEEEPIVKNSISEPAILEEKVKVSTPVVVKAATKNTVNSRIDYSERDYKIKIESRSYKANKLQIARENKYLLLAFSADWCMPCKVMEETVFKDPQIVKQLDDHFIKMKVDIDDFDGINLKQHFKVESIPTFIMLNKNDEIVGRYSRSMSTEKMLDILKNYH